MALLKKIKSATLMEVLVATVLIVIIFMIASLTLNNLFSNTAKFDTDNIKNHLNELEYQVVRGTLKVPYSETFKTWDVSITERIEGELHWVALEAKQKHTEKRIQRKIAKQEL